MYDFSAAIAMAERARSEQLPTPSGYKLLIALPRVNEKTERGLFLPEERREAETVAAFLGLVLAMGPDAYKDENKFPTGPYCKVGDFVLFRPYSGSRFRLNGEELRLINDDTVDAVVDDPTGYSRV